ncbi:acetate--CoA ligase [Colwellia sp. MB02u-10]|uniref:acetate--CoA ligase n=1 Tax=Colwellia sp. MB02u-10 TaxID=2759828 RepID=UPI0015F442EA|nr:acetate--CoA ligase [Colwellia sp. MB02u-10]MBA6341735.1 acetate--CoA ligase [Colwellia sp. MB02u-10]
MSENIINKMSYNSRDTNLYDYQQSCDDFNWQTDPNKTLNIAYQAVDKHLNTSIEDKVALRWLGKDEQLIDYSYRDLAEQTSLFASVLAKLGFEPGVRVFSLVGRLPLLYISALGTLKFGGVFTPLFSAFGPEPIRSRMEIGEVNVLVTTKRLYDKKIATWWHELPHLKVILFIDSPEDENISAASSHPLDKGCYWLTILLTDADTRYPCAKTHGNDMALLHFTSGTTGQPKGVIHVHQAVVAHQSSAKYALNLKQDDIYWCTADPGWVTGTSYGIIAPLCLGVTMIVDEAEFEVERWYHILQQQKITIWYTAPTAIRMLMKAGTAIREQYDLSALTFIASVGEPLNAEAVRWSEKVLGLPFHDNWWQTETGAIMIANFASQPIKPGSMGLPLPGITAAIVKRNAQGRIETIEQAMQIGELALKQGWPSMFRGYLHREEKYQQCFQDGWYLTGDLAKRDAQGYYWFVGRADDLIKSSGHLIGPFEIESALMEHEVVAEVGVIGIPDEITGQKVKAYVTLNPDVECTEHNLVALQKELKGFARKKLGAAVAPKEIIFRKNLPKTRSGKIMRRLLKARELNLPEGDISTLESDEQ